MTEMVHGAAPVTVGEPLLPKWWRTIDRWTLLCVCALFGIGLLLGLAASPPLADRNGLPPFYYVQKQAIFGTMAFVALLLCSMLSPKQVRRAGVLAFIFAFAALCLLPFFGTNFGKGAIRWYSLGFGSFQPSEFLKPSYVILAAWLMSGAQEIGGPPGRSISALMTAVIVGILAMQPDYGQASLILFGWGVMYFVAGAPMTLIVGIAGIVVAAGVLAYRTSEHVAGRIDGYLSADVSPNTQIAYAANAIRDGGVFGVGVGEGEVKSYLPDAHTDFIIAVAAEEYGLILVLIVVALFATITLRSLMRLLRERDPFVRYAGCGLACILGMQAMINVGVAVRLLPTKGMTLPFVSYGGSSVIAAGITVGMLLALTRTRPQGRIEDLLRRRPA
ncbi:peptidoglycan glycosyltransferase FtsW [Meridianimarinicoccus aquatilis]|uniref:Probable peptidoglycan glycosyltransferase FtsW n=1 Tax=Meridianimarinicoccus aquatilis TaxID=2552766 RepID=A0A4R6AA14_9RHOB|nr:putative peptidoglycan glycosyltransferase FtsW [Fluviibacterium aquatile]QIE41686.1 cell division protein FtsW [Rhodobacteraceae bacterium SC52]TDL79755.1 cell division protein FtsW [Fluviibacterium aquatile]